MSGLYKILSNPNREKAKKYAKRVTKGPGTYGIFIRNNRSNDKLGQCLYIGQSINVKNRVGQHNKNILKAHNYMVNGKGYQIELIPRMYFGIANRGVKNIIIVKLLSVDSQKWNKLNRKEKETLLTIIEQFNIDSFKPIFNAEIAKPSDFSGFMNEFGQFKV